MSPALLSTACAALVLAVGFGLGTSPAADAADDAVGAESAPPRPRSRRCGTTPSRR
jgi:hypothetical protein